MSTFRYRLRGASEASLDTYVEAGSGATVDLLARAPWTEVTLVDDTREPDLDEFMAGLGYVPDTTGPVVLVTSDHVMGTESIVLVDATGGPVDVTIPTVGSRVGDELIVMKVDASSNLVTVVPSGGNTIAGQVTQVFSLQGQSFRVLSDALSTDWNLVASRRATDIVFDNTGSGIPGSNLQDALNQVVTQDITASEPFVAGEGLALGGVVVLNTLGEVIRANSSIAGDNWRVAGVARAAALIGANVQVFTKAGASASTRFAVAPAAASNGQLVFLNSTSGLASITPPTASGNSIFVVGILQGADGVSLTPTVIFRPQFVALRT